MKTEKKVICAFKGRRLSYTGRQASNVIGVFKVFGEKGQLSFGEMLLAQFLESRFNGFRRRSGSLRVHLKNKYILDALALQFLEARSQRGVTVVHSQYDRSLTEVGLEFFGEAA